MPTAVAKSAPARAEVSLKNCFRDIPPFSLSGPAALGLIEDFLSGVANLAERWLTGRYFRLKITAAAILVSLLVSFPPYRSIIAGLHHAGGELKALTWKVQHPLTPFPVELKDYTLGHVRYGTASHVNKLELRLTLPLLGHLSHTGAWTIFLWNHLAAVGVFYLLASLSFEALQDQVGSALFTIGLGATFFGTWFFRDFGFGDGVAFFFLLLSIAFRQPLLAAASFVAAAFCDERCLTAIPLLLLYLVIRYRRDDQRAERNLSCLAVLSGAGAWAVLRWWLAVTFHLSTGTSSLASLPILEANLTSGLMLLAVFKAAWILPVLALVILVARRNWLLVATLVAAVSAALVPAFLVVDFDRSVAYCFVVLLIGLQFLRGDNAASRKLLAAILLANILLSAPSASILRLAM